MKRALGITATLGVVVLLLIAYLLPDSPHAPWRLPAGYPQPTVPVDNPSTVEKVALGRWLFYDKRLSVNQTMSCASCHIQALAFTDGKARSIGATGEHHPRSSMSLVNVAYASRLTWANHMLDALEEQALTPLFGEVPIEMGLAGKERAIVEMLKADDRYARLFRAAFPGDPEPVNVLSMTRSIAAFVRTIVSFDSPYDRYVAGDASALSAAQLSGLALFNSERLECFHCHGGFNFTDSTTHQNSVVDNVGFHNTGLYNIGLTGAYPPGNTGLHELTGDVRDMGRFRAPTLRNIALTAPYMHDGSIESLDKVLDHYAAGGRKRRNPYKSPFLRGFEVSEQERKDLLAFFSALTDESVIRAAEFADPFTNN